MMKRIILSAAIVYGVLAYAGIHPHDIGREMHSLSQQGAHSMMGNLDDNDGYGTS